MRTPPKRLRKRPSDPLKGNLGMAMFDLAKGGTTLLVSARVGSRGLKLPTGYELDTCEECGSAVWVNSGFVAHFRRNGKALRIECTDCAM
jgi:hypothetical protein